MGRSKFTAEGRNWNIVRAHKDCTFPTYCNNSDVNIGKENKMETRKVVINRCYGGFGLSHKAVMRYADLKGIKLYPWIDDLYKDVYGDRATLDNPSISPNYTTVPEEQYQKVYKEEKQKPVSQGRYAKSNQLYFSYRDIPRDDPDLIRTVEEMGEEANGRFGKLEIVEIPADVSYIIEEYDGIEWIAEEHRTWP